MLSHHVPRAAGEISQSQKDRWGVTSPTGSSSRIQIHRRKWTLDSWLPGVGVGGRGGGELLNGHGSLVWGDGKCSGAGWWHHSANLIYASEMNT